MVPQRRLLLSLFLFFITGVAAFAQDGMYADFVTSMGNFTCKLEFEKTPRTVASFVGLASGTKSFLNLKTGAIQKKPFYDGLTFHRVVSGFVIQGGSPAGDGTDGPGYRFRDELRSDLRHNKAGILSMAHSGQGTQTNGSQFFITLAATPHLDDVHTVFGEVISGMEVVNAIGLVPVDASSKPITPVIMQSVTIRRVGAAAQAFDAGAYGLPLVQGTSPKVLREGTKTFLSFPWGTHSEYPFYDSTNLTTWNKRRVGYYGETARTGNLEVTSLIGSNTQQFYRVPQVVYPTPSLEPTSLTGSTMVFTFGSGTGAQILTLNFTTATTGTFTLNNPATVGVIQSYTWTREYDIYEARLQCTLDNGFGNQLFSPVFGTASGGIFRYNGGGSTTGNFTYSPAAPLLLQVTDSAAITATSQEVTSSTTPLKRSTRRAKRSR